LPIADFGTWNDSLLKAKLCKLGLNNIKIEGLNAKHEAEMQRPELSILAFFALLQSQLEFPLFHLG